MSTQKLRDMNLHAIADELEQLRKFKAENDRLRAKLAAMESELSSLPAKWSEDSSLETWFPLTSDEMESLREEVSELRAYKEAAEKQEPFRWALDHFALGVGTTLFDREEEAIDFSRSLAGSSRAIPLYAKPVPADKPAVAVPDGFREIVEAVAHIGVDFGYGNFALSQEHIEKARALLAAAPSHSQHSVQSTIIEFLNEAEELIGSYPYLYVEIARTRTTDWMAHLRERPNGNVIAESGQGLSAEEACEQILNNLNPARCSSHEIEQGGE